MTKRPIALAGIGKIARDAHIPALADSPDWELAATLSRSGGLDGLPNYESMEDFLAADTGIDAVSLALPPGPRFGYARQALGAGLHVAIEKPPATTLTQCRALRDMAGPNTFYVTWHARMGGAVAACAKRLEGARVRRVSIDWREDVRQFHPGQDWVWEAGNLGVFDPGINAFSVLTAILPDDYHLSDVEITIPQNRETPISADLAFAHRSGAEMTGRLDWSYEGDPIWEIRVDTDAESLCLKGSGDVLIVDGASQVAEDHDEYAALYARFAALVRDGQSETDLRPMELVADAFLLARRRTGPAFEW